MKPILSFFLSILFILTLGTPLFAVDFQEQLQKMAAENAENYISPFSTAFGSGMNSGLYHTAKPHSLLGFDVGIKMALTFVPDEDLTFIWDMGNSLTIPVSDVFGIPNNELTINPNNIYTERETPTVFGDKEQATLSPDPDAAWNEVTTALKSHGLSDDDINNLSSEIHDLINNQIKPIPTVMGIGFDMLPVAIPQVSVGLIMGTEVLIRYLPPYEITDLGEINFLGIGIKHNLSQYIPIPMFPVDITGQYVWQKLEIGDLLESNHTAINIHVSKGLGIPGLSITPYLGAGIEMSDLKISDYTITGSGNPLIDGTTVNGFTLDGENKTRLSAGVRLGLGFITINGDWNLGAYQTASVGLGITLR